MVLNNSNHPHLQEGVFMLKQCFKLAAFAGIALIAGCSQQNPVSVKSGGDGSPVGLSTSLPSGAQVPAELETITNPINGYIFIIMKGTDGQVFYKSKKATGGGSWSAWQNTGYYAYSNIATVACPGNATYNAPGGAWVIFQGGTTSGPLQPKGSALMITLLNTGSNGSLSSYIFSEMNSFFGALYPVRPGSLCAIQDADGFPTVFYIQDYDSTVVCWIGESPMVTGLQNNVWGSTCVVDTLSPPYGTSGYMEVFWLGPNDNLMTITQSGTSFFPGSPGGGRGDIIAFNWNTAQTIGTSNYGYPLKVAKNKDGHLEVFSTNTSGFILHNWQQNATTWSGWSQLVPQIQITTLCPSVGTNADGRLELFFEEYTGSDYGIMAHQWQTAPSTGPWSTPMPLSPTGSSNPPQYFPYELVMLGTFMPQCVGTIDSNGTFEEGVFSISNWLPTDSIYYIHQTPNDAGWTNWTMFN